MTYNTVTLPLVGGDNPNRASSQSTASTKNMYIDVARSGQYQSSLLAWPGAKAWSTGSGVRDRGMHVHSRTGLLYKITDTTLYSVASDGTQTSLGTIAGSGRVVMADDGTNVLIATGGTAYQWSGSALTTVADAVNSKSVDVINNQAIWQLSTNEFNVANAGDPDVLNALNDASAEAVGDDLVRVYAFKNTLYLMCATSTEAWYNSGTGSPPFARIQNGVMTIGIIASTHAVTSNDTYLYWISDTKRLYRTSAYQPENVTNLQMAHRFDGLDMSDAELFAMEMSGQNFILLMLPGAGRTFAYSETINEWIELTYSATESRHIASSYAYAHGKHLIASRFDGNIYEWDLNTYTDNGAVIIRERVTDPINASQLGINGARLLMSRFEVIMQKGVGLVTGQGDDPQVMFSASYDHGKTYSDEDWVKIGRTGESRARVEWYNMASFYDMCVKIRVSDPVFIAMHSAAIDVRGFGW